MKHGTRIRRRSFRLPRQWSNAVLRELGRDMDGSVVNVSAWDDRDKEGSYYRQYFPRASDYTITNFSGERGLASSGSSSDLELDLAQPLPEDLKQGFDVVFNHTTLEHIFDVSTAFSNLCLLSRDLVIVVVPFAQEVHFTESYGDFWRFTPMGLRKLFQENGLGVAFEAASPHADAGIYVLFVGTRHPERWRDKLPPWQPIDELGRWIGRRHPLVRLRQLFRRLR